MSKRTYYPNKTIEDSRLPFWLEITSGLKVYARHSTGELRRCETIELKKKRWLVINHQGFIITLKGFEPEKECPECKGSCEKSSDQIDVNSVEEMTSTAVMCPNCKGKGKLPEHFIYEIKKEEE